MSIASPLAEGQLSCEQKRRPERLPAPSFLPTNRPRHFCSDASIHPKLMWFLSHGASLEARTRNGLNALSWTAAYGPVRVLRALAEYGVDKEMLTRTNALHEAVYNYRQDRIEAIAFLVDELGADIHAIGAITTRRNLLEESGGTPLHFAVESGRREHIRFLLDRGARITDKNVEGRDVRVHGKYDCMPEGWEVVEEWFAEKGLEIPGNDAEDEGEEPLLERLAKQKAPERAPEETPEEVRRETRVVPDEQGGSRTVVVEFRNYRSGRRVIAEIESWSNDETDAPGGSSSNASV